ncbi:hypothetical protein AVEN_149834-1 [Araneus ventricosus]|uniref:Uncharacterized protein n=1 Tax=Araneus ventricosus TaxID=182803 RepID=A0A4Y2CW16_ARAVE|nr:hypothetical protein AVEN_195447-1 [Araneus ventricosus]GBM08681.1 hypothetical protein AVEN_9133-1 [Araneus ventricosus]GBM08700.1 hypothetical protein AVEN_118902-1 [Araneus ventricosus]GBM08797.1 hypothetical protein AVEN_149834-1 [Araneus ventricosus]
MFVAFDVDLHKNRWRTVYVKCNVKKVAIMLVYGSETSDSPSLWVYLPQKEKLLSPFVWRLTTHPVKTKLTQNTLGLVLILIPLDPVQIYKARSRRLIVKDILCGSRRLLTI